MTDTVTNANEAIEFEYALSSFDHCGPADSEKLEDYDALYVVYWDRDEDEGTVRRRVSRCFKGQVHFVCLAEYFVPSIQRERDCLGAYWQFCPDKKRMVARDAYQFAEIAKDTTALVEKGSFDRLEDRVQQNWLGVHRVRPLECDSSVHNSHSL
jgi:hypothetical protein